ncbi:MAG TPA: hypothetical protein PKH24_04160 [Sedimentisphaerales bacterium]|jgi:hypothetical protein|nr:hypothetical protein [Sedimentisphaerales bacterium]HNU29958.1 hypothetical protein [Sedimentisphaerales bacterium]
MSTRIVLALLTLSLTSSAQNSTDAVGDLVARLPTALREYKVIVEPDQNEPEWWAGAPSVVRDKTGTFWLACRMRTADAPRGLRGYEIRILRSDDGVHFTKVLSIRREDVPIPGFERPALLTDPRTGRFKLYACGPWKDGPWSILKFDDANDPARFEPASAKPVIQPQSPSYERDVIVDGYKDPFILFAEGRYHCYVIGTMRRTERIYHFHSQDGDRWEPVGSPYQSIMDLTGWHDFYVRPACVLPVGVGWLFLYEGSNCDWYDPVYNIATGVGFTFDLHHVTDLTPDAPLVASTTPSERFHTWRYSHWMWVGDELWVYAEVARPNGSNEIRLFRLAR